MFKNILFWPDVYKEQGHWLPTLKWADALHNAGHTVRYMGILDCKGINTHLAEFWYNQRRLRAIPY